MSENTQTGQATADAGSEQQQSATPGTASGQQSGQESGQGSQAQQQSAQTQQDGGTESGNTIATGATAVPEAYNLKLAEGSPLDPSDLDKIAAHARTQGLSNEQGQALLQQAEELASGLLARQQAAVDEARQQWANDTWSDTDLGGANKEATLANVKRVMDRFAPAGSEFHKLLNETGYGNHPEFVRFVNAIGKAMAEDRPTAAAGGNASDGPKSAADVLYGQ